MFKPKGPGVIAGLAVISLVRLLVQQLLFYKPRHRRVRVRCQPLVLSVRYPRYYWSSFKVNAFAVLNDCSSDMSFHPIYHGCKAVRKKRSLKDLR
ncbi:hypothetical protein F4604DRAFT_899831 [Suillus subluteus]|nr:hypothetical protein F4604DRAFT_899831 [Suillus subluteus]